MNRAGSRPLRSAFGGRRHFRAWIALSGCGDDAGRIERSGPRQERPLVQLAWPGTPRGTHGDDACAAVGQFGVEGWEPDVVAHGDPDPDSADFDDDRLVAGRDGPRFGDAECVVQMDLVVASFDVGSGCQHGVGYPAV